MTFHTIRQQPAEGSLRGAQKSPRVVVSFERTVFDRIVGEANRRQVPFAQIVRELVVQAYRSAEDGKASAGRERSDRVGEPLIEIEASP